MDRTIISWLEARESANQAREFIDTMLDKASYLRSENFDLRHAVADDIVEGAIIWYPKWEESVDEDQRCWRMVEDVMNQNDVWKAYTADCGCRYGLHGAFVEVELEDQG